MDDVEGPRKRLKATISDAIDIQDAVVADALSTDVITEPAPPIIGTAGGLAESQDLREAEVGITYLLSSSTAGFSGILKKRYGT
jgi:hypothetical protein